MFRRRTGAITVTPLKVTLELAPLVARRETTEPRFWTDFEGVAKELAMEGR